MSVLCVIQALMRPHSSVGKHAYCPTAPATHRQGSAARPCEIIPHVKFALLQKPVIPFQLRIGHLSSCSQLANGARLAVAVTIVTVVATICFLASCMTYHTLSLLAVFLRGITIAPTTLERLIAILIVLSASWDIIFLMPGLPLKHPQVKRL